MGIRFTKMHGLGNDYVFIDTFAQEIADPPALARTVSDRHFGVGSDGLILIGPSDRADARMRVFNADGSEAEMCGNGARCAAKYILERGLARSRGPFGLPEQPASFNASLLLETGRGLLTIGLDVDHQGRVGQVCVNMGQPIFEPARIPVQAPGQTGPGPVALTVRAQDRQWTLYCLSMGNPHAVLFLEDLAQLDAGTVGPAFETLPAFPNRTNVHFVQVIGEAHLKVITWERGSGLTLACGTGAAASCVAAAATGRAGRTVTTHLPGGDLRLIWHTQDNCVYMIGPATEVFDGDLLI